MNKIQKRIKFHKKTESHPQFNFKKPEMLLQINTNAINRYPINYLNYIKQNKSKHLTIKQHKRMKKNEIKNLQAEIQYIGKLIGSFSKESQNNLNKIDISKKQNSPLLAELKEKIKLNNSTNVLDFLIDEYRKKGYKIPEFNLSTKNIFNKNPLITNSQYDLEDFYQKEHKNHDNENFSDIELYDEKYWNYLNKIKDEYFDPIKNKMKHYDFFKEKLSKKMSKNRNSIKKQKNNISIEMRKIFKDIRDTKHSIMLFNEELAKRKNEINNNNIISKRSCLNFDYINGEKKLYKSNGMINLNKNNYFNKSISNYISRNNTISTNKCTHSYININQNKNAFKLITAIPKNEKKPETERFYENISANNCVIRQDIINEVLKYIISRKKNMNLPKKEEINKYILYQLGHYKNILEKYELSYKHKKILNNANSNNGIHNEIYEKLKEADKIMEKIENLYMGKYIKLKFQ